MTAIENKKRILGLDLVRCIAVFFVISVHYILYSNFYSGEIKGTSMYILTAMRWLFYTCVPLFLILTGYLKQSKKVEKDHYKSIIPILISYVIISIITILVFKFYYNKEESIYHYIKGIFNFSTIGNAWYVEMYIGLFLCIPFLNILYQNIKTKKQKQILIFTLLFLVSIPNVLASISIKGKSLDILPNWWTGIYPFLYYFIGCYIKEYQIKIPKIKNIIYLLICLVIETTITFFYCHGRSISAIFEGYAAFPTVVISVLLFLLLYDINIKNRASRIFITDISKLSFDIYLLSFITERIIYEHLNLAHLSSKNLIIYYPIYSVVVLFITYICVFIKRCIIEGIIKLIKTEV